MRESLRSNIASHLDLSGGEIDSFCSLFHPREIKKKCCLLKKGEICKFEALVVKGMFRVYHIDSRGAEQILYFALENWWISDIDSFTNEKTSEFCIEAIEDSTVLVISKADKEFAYKSMPKIEKLFRIITQKNQVALERRLIDTLSKTAHERYIDFTEKFPKHYQKISNLHIASYLGISREFLSKIRSKITLEK
ncbi:Crp/Fnr family transcriptional regulator [Flavobacterium sp. FlaQc-47]|uniref:Crp/Fnr family transcriptional regulator n=1 Tax=Flavobacterium sp. FlaQc-47 TaxID=3374180 RepID=UPI003756C3E3